MWSRHTNHGGIAFNTVRAPSRVQARCSVVRMFELKWKSEPRLAQVLLRNESNRSSFQVQAGF